MGGGGGQSSTTTSQLPDWAQPYAEQTVKQAVDLYNTGDLQATAGLNPAQQDALSRQQELGQRGGVLEQIAQDSYVATQAYRDAAAGTGLFGSDALGQQTQALESTIGPALQRQLGQLQGQQALRGGLGSARAQAGINQALTQTAGNIASQELGARRQAALGGAGGVLGAGGQLQSQFGAGVGATGQAGQQIQSQQQREADANLRGIQNLAGILTGGIAGQQQNQTVTGGGK